MFEKEETPLFSTKASEYNQQNPQSKRLKDTGFLEQVIHFR